MVDNRSQRPAGSCCNCNATNAIFQMQLVLSYTIIINIDMMYNKELPWHLKCLEVQHTFIYQSAKEWRTSVILVYKCRSVKDEVGDSLVEARCQVSLSSSLWSCTLKFKYMTNITH